MKFKYLVTLENPIIKHKDRAAPLYKTENCELF